MQGLETLQQNSLLSTRTNAALRCGDGEVQEGMLDSGNSITGFLIDRLATK
jgi:hypothetical protein